MLMVMDMSTGKTRDDSRDEFEIEFGQFKDEVLNAGWMPPNLTPGPELQLGLQEVHAQPTAGSDLDAESFLNAVYRNQR